MEKLETLIEGAKRELTAMQGPATIPANTRTFRTQFSGVVVTHPEVAAARDAAVRFCEGMYDVPPPRWLSLLGQSGRGKSFLAELVRDWRRSLGPGRTYYRWIDLLTDFREDRALIARFMRRCDESRLLILDDVCAGYETEFSAAILGEIAERRVGRWTMFTANLSLEDFARLDSRIASRMIRGGNEVITFRDAPDFAIWQRNGGAKE
jgi:DNA replication protein DnaC